ncbi:TolC family outer membrane protein [Aliiroseovarius sp. PTFE2010]|uniref:TolC family outer membrane protein n=1 Tax=Aliiroseovarius sp. PTFE2010 TaxID=3417190 RepID=UPI003CF61C76
MKVSKFKCMVGALAVSLGLTGGAAWAESLADALASAYKTSGLLEQNRALLRIADEDVAQAIAGLRPIVGYSAGMTYSSLTEDWVNSLNLTAQMTLYDFGKSQLAIDAAKENVLATRERLVGVEQAVLQNAVTAYFDVIEAQAIVGLRASNVRLITQELRAAEDRFEVGEVTRTDVSQAQALLAQARANEQLAQGDLAAAREAYKAVTGHYPENLHRPAQLPATATSIDAARAVAREQHPSIKAAKRDVTVAEINIMRARASMRPTLGASASVGLTDDNPNDTIGLSLSGPIYQGGNLRSLERVAAASRDAARANLIQVVRTVEQSIGTAWSTARVTTASIEATARQVRAAREAFSGVQEEATLGARTTLDVLEAEQTLLNAQVSAIQAELGRYRAVYSVLGAMGLLTVDHLGLNVPRYDPSAYYNAVKTAPLTRVSPQGEKLDRVLESLGKN